MLGIFKDAGRGTGAFSSCPTGIWPKSALAASHSLESAPDFLRSRSLRQRILFQTVIHTQFVHAA